MTPTREQMKMIRALLPADWKPEDKDWIRIIETYNDYMGPEENPSFRRTVYSGQLLQVHTSHNMNDGSVQYLVSTDEKDFCWLKTDNMIPAYKEDEDD